MKKSYIPKAAFGVACIYLLLIMVGCASSQQQPTEFTIAKSGADRPTTAVDARTGAVYVAWVGTKGKKANVFLSRLLPGKKKFSKPIQVNEGSSDISQQGQSPAQVRVGPEGNVYVIWIRQKQVKGLRFPAGDIRLARSTDDGKTFLPAINVTHATSYPSSQEFQNMAIGPDGTIYVSWLDARLIDKYMLNHQQNVSDSTDSSHAHQPSHKSNMKMDDMQMDHMDRHGMEKAGLKMQIRVSHSTDGGKHFSKGAVVSTETCQCCRTAIAVGPKGTVYTAWRQIYGGLENQIRDIAIARSTDGGQSFTKPKRVHADNWHIRACPEAGPALAVDTNGRVHILWYTGAEGKSGVYYAVSKGGGAPFKSVKALVKDVGRSQVAAAGSTHGEAWIAWADHKTGGIRSELISGNKMKKSVEVAPGSAPAVAVGDGRHAIAWQDSGAVKVQVKRNISTK